MSLMTSQWRPRPPSTFIAAAMRPSNTVFIRWFRPDNWDIWDFKAAGTFQNLTNTTWAWYKVVTPFFYADTGIYPHLASQYHAWPSVARGIPCCVWIKSRIRGSKQGVTNNNKCREILTSVAFRTALVNAIPNTLDKIHAMLSTR